MAGAPAVTEITPGAASAAGPPGASTAESPGASTAESPGAPAHAAGSPAEATFALAVAAFTAGLDAQRRNDLQFEDVPAPKRLAPYARAVAATIQRDKTDVAWGRLVLLYDPDGQDG